VPWASSSLSRSWGGAINHKWYMNKNVEFKRISDTQVW
jgi:hypothetical protein